MEVRFLNIEYFFNQFFSSIKYLWEKISEFSLVFLLVFWKSIHLYVSVILLIGIIFLLFKISSLRKRKIKSYVDIFLEENLPEDRSVRWVEIKGHMESDNPSEWKVAIIEADNIMDSILKRIGYEGKTLAERLKNIEPSDFDNLQNIWEAHKIRNRIVHEKDFSLKKDEAKKVIGLYEKALKEFRYI